MRRRTNSIRHLRPDLLRVCGDTLERRHGVRGEEPRGAATRGHGGFRIRADDGNFLESGGEGEDIFRVLEQDSGICCCFTKELAELRGVNALFGRIEGDARGVCMFEKFKNLY